VAELIVGVDTGTEDAVAITAPALHPHLDLAATLSGDRDLRAARCTGNSLQVVNRVKPDLLADDAAAASVIRAISPSAQCLFSPMHGAYLEPHEDRSKTRADVRHDSSILTLRTDTLVAVDGSSEYVAADSRVDLYFSAQAATGAVRPRTRALLRESTWI
jgi:hypothetical protein